MKDYLDYLKRLQRGMLGLETVHIVDTRAMVASKQQFWAQVRKTTWTLLGFERLIGSAGFWFRVGCRVKGPEFRVCRTNGDIWG